VSRYRGWHLRVNVLKTPPDTKSIRAKMLVTCQSHSPMSPRVKLISLLSCPAASVYPVYYANTRPCVVLPKAVSWNIPPLAKTIDPFYKPSLF